MRAVIALVLAVTAASASAQTDPMEEQRCVWRCLADAQGADDPAYGACVQAQCGAAPTAAPQPATPPATPGTPPIANWVYGDHPLLGRGAFGQTAQGVVGFACGSSGYPLDFRLTNSFYRGPAVTVMTLSAGTAFSIDMAPGPATQQSGDSCGLGLEAFRAESTMLLIDGAIVSVTRDAFGTLITLQGGGRTAAVRTGGEALQVLGGTAVPLTGSAAAIERLLAACPAAREDAGYVCGD